MNILDRQFVVRYHVEFTDEETDRLQEISFLPPDCPRPARLWTTASELIETMTILYGAIKTAEWIDALKREPRQ